MTSLIERLPESDKEHVKAIAQQLARYGLGILDPHAHDNNGHIVPLPSGVVSYENALNVKFIPQEQLPVGSVAVGWRWENGTLTACAHCCTFT
jgi:hypothetical protein